MSKPLPLNLKDKEAELGTLIVVLLKARNLYDKHSFRKSDVFAQATLNGTQKRTAVDIKGGQHPEWDGEVRFSIAKNASAKHRVLEVACYSQEPRSEDLMGRGTVDITQTLQTGEFDDWVPLEIDGVKRGEIYLEMTYYANISPPLHTTAPNKQLSALQHQSSGLSRRPSKLSPAERLSRPPPDRPPDQPPIYGQRHPAPVNLNAQPSRLNDQHVLQPSALIAGPNTVPASLKPSRATDASQSGPGTLPADISYSSSTAVTAQGQATRIQNQSGLPTILWSGQPHGSPPSTSSGPQAIPHRQQSESGHTRVPSTSPPSRSPYLNATNPYISLPQGSPPNPYLGGSVTPPKSSTNPYIGNTPEPPVNRTNYGPYLGYGITPGTQTQILQSASVPPSVPQEQFPFWGALPPPNRQQSYLYDRPPSLSTTTSAEGDPYLRARYQAPLPLPSEPSSAPTKISSAPPKATASLPQDAHLEALRRAEEEAKRRREQELKDLELAMELDRQLNMDSSTSSAAPIAPSSGASNMPGSW